MKSVDKDMIDINYEECREGEEQVLFVEAYFIFKG